MSGTQQQLCVKKETTTADARAFWRDVAMCDCAMAERSGKAEFFHFMRSEPDAPRQSREMARWIANPYETYEPGTSLLEWAWDLGWRLAEFLHFEITLNASTPSIRGPR